jgi:hypothetical protein
MVERFKCRYESLVNHELLQIPINLSAEWQSKRVMAVSLAADAPFRVAVLMYLPDALSWGLEPKPPAFEQAVVNVHFADIGEPYPDLVSIHVGYRRNAVSDLFLKENPREHVTMALPDTATTGQIIPVCRLKPHSITIAVFAIAKQNTEHRRCVRWRVRPELAEFLPAELTPLTSGRQSGFQPRAKRRFSILKL